MQQSIREFLRRGLAAACALAAAAALGGPAPAYAQSTVSSTIHGTVTDESGGALPGVTVTLTSPAIQVPQMIEMTGADGTYRFVELPAGVYRLSYEMQDFATVIREDLRLTVGFVARLDVPMKLGALSETVTVAGGSPVVDLTRTTTAVNLTKEALEAIPRGRGLWETVAMAPGVSTSRDAPDVGDSNLAGRSPIVNYGSTQTGKIEIEGVNVTTGTESNAGVYLHSFLFDEVQIKGSGNDAEVSVPGVNFIGVVKSGSNTYHGSALAAYQGPRLQSSNLNDTLRGQGLTEAEPLKYDYDVAGDLGGKIIHDKLWFYGAYAKQSRVSAVLGFAGDPGPDGRYLTTDDTPAESESALDSGALKLSWQATPKHRILGVMTPSLKYQPQRDGGRFRPLESTLNYRHVTSIYKGELQSMLSPKALLNVLVGYGGYDADYSAERAGFSRPGNPSRLDRETGLRTGPAENPRRTPRYRTMFDGGLSFFPSREVLGKHEMKVGWSFYWERTGDQFGEQPHGNYSLTFDRVNNVSNQPAEIVIRNWPIEPVNKATVYGVYLKDTWRISNRLTANWGVRYERQNAFVPEQSNPASVQFPSLFQGGAFNKLDVITWQRVVPRLGIAWDLTGDGRSVVKATWGLYNHILGDGFAGAYNANGNIGATFRWRDLNGDRDYTPGEVNLDPNGSDFISITGGSSNVLPDGLRQPKTTEVTARLRAPARRESRVPRALRLQARQRALRQRQHPPSVRCLQHPDHAAGSGAGRRGRDIRRWRQHHLLRLRVGVSRRRVRGQSAAEQRAEGQLQHDGVQRDQAHVEPLDGHGRVLVHEESRQPAPHAGDAERSDLSARRDLELGGDDQRQLPLPVRHRRLRLPAGAGRHAGLSHVRVPQRAEPRHGDAADGGMGSAARTGGLAAERARVEEVRDRRRPRSQHRLRRVQRAELERRGGDQLGGRTDVRLRHRPDAGARRALRREVHVLRFRLRPRAPAAARA